MATKKKVHFREKPKSSLTHSSDSPAPGQIKTLFSILQNGRWAEGAALAQKLTLCFPQSGILWKLLGVMIKKQGFNQEALAPMQKAAELLPGDAESHNNLGITCKDLFAYREAEAAFRRAIEIQPDYLQAHNELGLVLDVLGRYQEAEAVYRQAIAINPNYAIAHNNLGLTLVNLGNLQEAEAAYRRAIEIQPDYSDAHNNLGNIFRNRGHLQDAEVSFRRAIAIKPDNAAAHNNLGISLTDQGRLQEAEAAYRRALEIMPDVDETHSNLLFTMNYNADHHGPHLLDEARRYGQMAAKKAKKRFSSWICKTQPDRLKVGVVSGDLCNHPVGYFLESILACLNSSRIELIAYPTLYKEDELTARIKPYFSAWRPLIGHSDEGAAHLIHTDGIHLLLDLSGHTRKTRLPVFAWKPAPVQAAGLGYFATTGLTEMDYLLGDPYVTPVEDEGHFTEKIWRLPESRFCFTPPNVTLEVDALPALSAKFITFCCFNNLAKMIDAVVVLWSRVLHAVPDSRLFLKSRQLNDPATCDSTCRRFAVHGITSDRLLFEGSSTREKYLETYNRVDIALDTFPYPGGTVSVEALWMGVPVITRKGDRLLSHQGEGILRNVGLDDWIAEDDEDYVAKAVKFTSDLEKLAALRSTMRHKVLASPLFDASRFARHFEEALWGMWEQRCENIVQETTENTGFFPQCGK